MKSLESKGKTRQEVMSALMEQFGEKNPDVNVVPQGRKNKQPIA